MGHLLDPAYYKTLEYPHLGKFGSVMNLWYWIRSDPCHDAFRRATGSKLRKQLELHNNDSFVYNFVAIIANATYIKLQEYPAVIDEMRRMPKEKVFLSYYVPPGSKLRVCSNYADVIVPIANHIRSSLVHGVEPDFAIFTKEDADCSLDFVGGYLKQRHPEIYKSLTQTT